MVKPSEAEKNLVQSNAFGGAAGVTGPYGAVDRKLYVGNLHFNMTKSQLWEGHDYVNGGGGRGAAVLTVAEGGSLPKERELQGRTADNNNLTVLNNFNGRNLLEIKR
ncbi:hypothetical protein JHK87_025047 [Glycine soja]|nr:hypothetical protein JHK87_025047 [Glycine soja]